MDTSNKRPIKARGVIGIKDELEFSAFNAIMHAGRLQDKNLQAALADLEVHPAQYSCLFVICSNHGVNLCELARRLHIENSTASVAVKRMEKAGFITRRADTEDSRVTRLYPTPYGEEQFLKSKQIIGEYINHCFGAFSDKELFTFLGLLSRLAGYMEQGMPSPELL